MESSVKKEKYLPFLQAAVITAAFLIAEIVLLKLGAFGEGARLYLVDVPLRVLFGCIALFFLKRQNGSPLKELFTKKLSRKTWLLLIPFAAYLVLTLMTMLAATVFTGKMAGLFALNTAQQAATGFYEEGCMRGLMMCGLLKHLKDTKADRLKAVWLTGGFFGLSHGLNFFFGQDIPSTLLQVMSCALWGAFMAAVYMQSRSLTLVMVMHAVWDTVVRIPRAFCVFPESSLYLDITGVCCDVIQFGVLPITAVVISLKYDKLRQNRI